MKSKAAQFIEAVNKNQVNDATKWWQGLSKAERKSMLSKVSPEQVTDIYTSLYGSPTQGEVPEDMSKMKKVLMAGVLAAFIMASSGAAHAAAGQRTTMDQWQKQQAQTQTYQQKKAGGNTGGDSGPTLGDAVKKGGKILDVGKAAVDKYGTAGAQKRANRVVQDVSFVADVLGTLLGD